MLRPHLVLLLVECFFSLRINNTLISNTKRNGPLRLLHLLDVREHLRFLFLEHLQATEAVAEGGFLFPLITTNLPALASDRRLPLKSSDLRGVAAAARRLLLRLLHLHHVGVVTTVDNFTFPPFIFFITLFFVWLISTLLAISPLHQILFVLFRGQAETRWLTGRMLPRWLSCRS